MKITILVAVLIFLTFAFSGCKTLKLVPVAKTPLLEVRTRGPIHSNRNQLYRAGDYDGNYYRYHDKDHGKKNSSNGKRHR